MSSLSNTQVVKRTKRAIIIGASHGVGREIAIELSGKGYIVGLMGRNQDKLDDLWRELKNPSFIEQIDLENPDSIRILFHDLVFNMGGVDVVIITAATGFRENSSKDDNIIKINIEGFLAVANAALDYFENQRQGHLVCFSSVSALRANWEAPLHSASKAFVANFIEAKRLYYKMNKENKFKKIYLTDIRPCIIEDSEVEGVSNFWIMSTKKVAQRTVFAIDKKMKHSYLSFKWSVIAFLAKFLPDSLFYRIAPFRYCNVNKACSKKTELRGFDDNNTEDKSTTMHIESEAAHTQVIKESTNK